jgi:hypothetical protein
VGAYILPAFLIKMQLDAYCLFHVTFGAYSLHTSTCIRISFRLYKYLWLWLCRKIEEQVVEMLGKVVKLAKHAGRKTVSADDARLAK